MGEKLQNQKPTTKSKKVKSKLKTNKTKCIMTKRSLSLTQFRARPQKRPKAAHQNLIGERKRNLIVKHLVYREITEEATIDVEVKMEAKEAVIITRVIITKATIIKEGTITNKKVTITNKVTLGSIVDLLVMVII